MKHYFLFLFLLFACTNENDTPPPSDSSGEISAIENGLLPTFAIEGDEPVVYSIAERMRHYNVPGVSIAFFENNKIKWTYTAGYLSTDSLKKIDADTRFQAASISKPVAASGMMRLVESGQLSLDTAVNHYLTGWQIPQSRYTEGKPVTLRQIVTHTGGLTVHGFRGYAASEEVPTLQQILNGESPANSGPVLTDTIPESIWRYSGGGYTVMQLALENALDTSFADFMHAAVLEPVGMERSTYQQPLGENDRENVAIGHRPNGQKVTGNWHTYPEMAAAGLWTTPTDLAKWAMGVQRAYHGSSEEFISSETAANILTANQHKWGLGPGVEGEGDSLRFSHGGANEGYRCILMAFGKEGGQGIVIMTNGDLGGALFSEILRGASKYYGWNTHQQVVKTVIPLSTEKKKEFVGKYVDTRGVEVTVELKGDTLTGTARNNEFTLYPSGTDEFFDDQDAQKIEFQRDSTQAINGFKVEGILFKRLPANE